MFQTTNQRIELKAMEHLKTPELLAIAKMSRHVQTVKEDLDMCYIPCLRKDSNFTTFARLDIHYLDPPTQKLVSKNPAPWLTPYINRRIFQQITTLKGLCYSP